MTTSARQFVQFLVAVVAFVACGGDSAAPADPATLVSAVNIRTSGASLVVGDTLQLMADVMNAAGAVLVGKTVSWLSSRPNVATITPLGIVAGVSSGTTVITATSEGRTASVTLTVQERNRISLTSDPGDRIGEGGSYTYTKANSYVLVIASPSRIRFTITSDQRWDATFEAPANAVALAAGSYPNVARFPAGENVAGLTWNGEHTGCNTVTGSLSIDSLVWSTGPNPSLLGIDLRFEQHCNGSVPALRGTVHWRRDDPTGPPGPMTPIPANLWHPAAGATPSSGDFVYLEGQFGNLFSDGLPKLYQSGVSVMGSGAYIPVAAGGFHGEFVGMYSLSQIQLGYYGDLLQHPYENPVKGGLNWYGNGVMCGSAEGWFAVDRLNYVSNALAGIELRFEYRCGAQTLRGMVRWGRFSN